MVEEDEKGEDIERKGRWLRKMRKMRKVSKLKGREGGGVRINNIQFNQEFQVG